MKLDVTISAEGISANHKNKYDFITSRLTLRINIGAKIGIIHLLQKAADPELNMKLQLFAVLLVIAGSYALPANDVVGPSNGRNSVEYRIRRFIEQMSQRIDNAGFDPLEVKKREFDIDLEIVDLAVKGFVENLKFKGASDIKIKQLEYNYIYKRLILDVSLPKVSLSVGHSGFEAVIGDVEIEGQLKGSLSIKSIRVAGVGHVDVNLIGQINLRSVSLDCSIGDVKSDLKVVAQGNDLSESVNELLNDRIPNYLDENKNNINGALEVILSAILNHIWSI